MAVDNNFARLEQEVNRLLEVLERFKEENAQLQSRIEGLESENNQLKNLTQHLQQVEQEALKTRDEVKGRVESLLSRLDAIQL